MRKEAETGVLCLKNVNTERFLISRFSFLIYLLYLCTRKRKECSDLTINGALAQLVEHRTENPCVPGSIPGGTTSSFHYEPLS